jgi:hypothetical protein
MKNFKKVLALALALSMILSTMTTAFAANANDDKAVVLNQLGLFKGTSTTEFVPDLDKATDAAQALVLIGRALGWEVDAAATVTFTDVPDYAVPYVAYAVEKGITNGVSETEFGTAVISGKRMVTWFLAAAGYDKAAVWADTETYATETGMTVPTGTLRDDVVAVIYAGLMVKPVGSETTIVEDLVAADPTLEDAAVAAGLVDATPDVLEVESVVGSNLKEMVVKFNKEVDTKTVVDANFVVKLGSVKKATTATLAADKMSVTLKSSTNFENQKDYSVTIEKVKDLDGAEMTKVTKTVSVFDGSLPEVSGITVTGPKSLEITFTEPVKGTEGKVTIKSGSTTVGVNNDYTASAGKNVVTVNLYSSLKDGTDYTVTTSEFQDYANYTMINNSQDLSYSKNTETITASITKATQKYVVVEFSKPVKNLSSSYFYHTFSAWTAMGVYSDEDLTSAITSSNAYSKVYVKFADDADDHPLQAGTSNVTILSKVGSTEIKDNWDNVFAGDTIGVEVAADVTAPVVSEVKVSAEDTLKVTFDENVTFTSNNVKVYDPDGKSIPVTVSGSAKEYTITLDKSYSGKTVKVEIKDVVDASLQGNKLTLYTEDISITDKTAPTVSKVTKKIVVDGEQSLYVFFDEAVDDSALVNDNYYLEKAGTYKKLEDGIEFYDGNKIVRITLKDAEKDYVNDGYNLIVRNVKDAAGNAIIGQTVASGSILAYDDASNQPSIVEVRAIAKDKVEVEFDQVLNVVEASAFKIAGLAENVVGMEIGTGKDGNTVATLTIKESAGTIAANVTDNAAAFPVNTSNATVSNLANVFGVVANNQTITPSVDKIAPSIKVVSDKKVIETRDIDNDGYIDYLVVEFDEPIFAGSVSMNDFTVAGYTVKDAFASDSAENTLAADGRGTAVAKDDATVFIRVAEKTTGDTDATPKVSIAAGLKDVAGNAFEAVSDQASQDKAAPAIVKVDATVGSADVVITFSEPVTGGTAMTAETLAVTDFTFTDTSTGGATISSVPATATSGVETVTITLSAAVIQADIDDATDDTIAAAADAIFDLVDIAATNKAVDFK